MTIINKQNRVVDFSSVSSEKTAVTYKGMAVSYGDLSVATNALSDKLSYLGVVAEDIVAVYMNNSIEIIVAILAILSRGAIVLPINIDLPQKQINYILSSSKPKVLLHNQVDENVGKDYTITLYVDYTTLIDNSSHKNIFAIYYKSKALAYCIYTSGSSGMSKGVLLTYEGILNHIDSKVSLLNLTNESRMCLSFNIGFVASIWQILTPLRLGAQLFLYDDNLIKMPYQFLERVENDGIQVVSMISHSLSVYLQYIGDRHPKLSLSTLKHIILTGEKIEAKVTNEFYKKYNHIILINAYGQTECSDDTFHYIIPPKISEENLPIGKPIANISYRIFDENMSVVSKSEKGELYIGGCCLAQGYVNDAFLTSINFTYISGTLYYRTGDIVRENENHDVIYLGRIDNQIKIHGHRIEPEGIEAYINQMVGINQSIVTTIALSAEEQRLAAFYTSETNIFSNNIVRFLSANLPQYMIPSVYTRVERFFENSNGKIDRSKIGECTIICKDDSNTAHTSASDMTDIQKEALKIIDEKINGVYCGNISLDMSIDNLALDSIAFISMIVTLEDAFDFEFEEKMLLSSNFPSIRSLLDYVEKMSR